MKKIITAILMAYLITACGSPTAMPATAPVDPFVALDSAQKTAAAAQDQAQTYSRQLTATAEAPIIEITQTAAALVVAQTQSSINATATAMQWTPTSTFTPTVQPTATPNATATIISEQTNAEIKRIQQQTERGELANKFWAIILPLFLLAVIVLIAYAAITYSRKQDVQVIERGNGDAPLMFSLSKRQVIDMDANPNYRGGFEESLLRSMLEHYLKQKLGMQPTLPLITEERQDMVKGRDQLTDLKTRTKITNAALDKFMKEHALNTPASMPAAITAPVVTEDDNNMPLPPWDFIKQWDGTSKPLGFGKTGLITAKAASPHILISGKTGSGKTIYMMRTLTAASLAKGSQVINIGYSNAGYGVFEKHVNFHNVQLPDPRYVIECLAQVYDELKDRKTMIGGDMVEWEYWPGGQPPRPFMDVMLDELGNMAEDIYAGHGLALTKELWSYISRIANEGRKVGIRFVAALQDPTSKSMDLRFRRNCTLVAFRQGDRAQSDAFIGESGAEQLSIGHFMARTDSLVIGGGFAPTDAELLDFLAKSPVRPAEKPKWIDAVSQPRIIQSEPEALQIIEPNETESLPVKPVDEIAEMAERIRSQWTQGMSGRQVANLLGLSQYGGSLKTKTDKVIAYLTATTKSATPTEKQPEIGSFATEMA